MLSSLGNHAEATAAATSLSDDEKITHTATTNGIYAVGVHLNGGTGEGNQYDLGITTAVAPTATATATATAT